MAKKQKKRRLIRRPFEALGFKLAQLTIPYMPRIVLYRVSRLVGWASWFFPLKEKTYGLKNLNAVFGDTKSPAEKKALLISSYSSFCLTMCDLFWFSVNREERLKCFVEFDESSADMLAGGACIYITAHFGNWEVMAQAMALRGLSLSSVAAKVKNPLVDSMFYTLREKTGQTIIPQKGALRSMISLLRKEQTVGFVLDQNTKEKDGGIPVEFLGLPMMVSSAPALLSYRTGSVIRVGFCARQPNGIYKVFVRDAIVPPEFDKNDDKDEIVKALTQQIEDQISEEIRSHPEFWLWSYKHWRKVAGKTYPDHYPDYKTPIR